MIYVLLSFWAISAVLAVRERKILGMIVFLGIFSTISAVCFLVFGAPDVAMAEAAVSTFSTIFLIICFEKYFVLVTYVTNEPPPGKKLLAVLKKRILPLCFSAFLLALFIYFIPSYPINTYVKDRYLAGFMGAVGGQNAVTAVYLGYRMYDTMFEALMLVVSVIGVAYMSLYGEDVYADGHLAGVSKSNKITIYTIRVVCPAIVLFGAYLILNGHISPGGGFQGGVAIATFFICRYLIHNINDMHFERMMMIEKLTFAGIVILAVVFILLGVYVYFPEIKNVYLMTMNTLIGMKVACGFMIIFYRYIAFERR